ncbi:UDP-glucose dehydrogenase family protein [Saccharicrinis fermentans]|uniref:UDP-glucose 6-dehydrogenase n=1 Tax=Saccharicrinis fermentans DSM 9555 = JCM 21142 TaxID=869213 RepID=W7Y749_9BACT|nr:UDP-glucose/GDP-mannose dehydrogenase family protein [Saccharicrinis fermentans]GAF04067.1 UDP-glucose 6-dehydrogenase TuaD [Saccharicrinis fermentans DSM 9555 = JCM 21142]
MKISIVGTGYVGLVSGTCFADVGITVTCVDIDEKKIENLKKGVIPIYEPGLETMVHSNIEKGRLFFSTSLKDSLEQADVIFIAVGTPPDEDGSADLKYVLEVARQIGKHINHYMVIVTKSTVPIGTAKKVKAAITDEIEKRGIEVDFDVASNPEFLKEGNAIQDFLKPDRIVVGTESEKAQKMMNRLYKPFLLNGHPIIFMDIPSAEMTKYAANSMLATKISFMNDMANLCEIVGADITSVRKGIGSDARIGNKFIYAGAGYGGSCFPKDVKAVIKTADLNGYKLRLLEAVEEVNNHQKHVLVSKIKEQFGTNLNNMIFALWGLSFKPKTDDMREAPALVVIEELIKLGAKVKAYDPVAMEEAKRILGDKIEYGADPYDVLIDADALIVITEWSEFRIPNFKVIEKLLKNKVIFDGRNIYEPAEVLENGFSYYSIGRAAMHP